MIMIGHRGAAGYEPENTLRSFRRAISLGADMIELDVRLSRDGELIIIHDRKLDRTTTGRGLVRKKTLAELKKLDAGQGGEIPTLAEALDAINRRVKVNIELKDKGAALPTARLIKQYRHNGWKYSHFFVSSYDAEELRRFCRLCPPVKAGLLIKGPPFNFIRRARRLGADAVNIHSRYLNRRTVSRAHRQGLKVFAVAANRAGLVARMKALEVDGVFCDFPDRIS